MLLRRLPALTQFYGIKPQDIDHMTGREIAEYVRQHDEYQAANQT